MTTTSIAHLSAAAVLLVGVQACTETATSTPGQRARGLEAFQPQFSIVGDPSTVADVPVGNRQSEVSKAFRSYLERLPERDRVAAQAEFERGFIGIPLSSHDPEIANIWSRIVSLRMAEAKEPYPRRMNVDGGANPTIKVALLASLEDQGARAVVLRQPDDAGIPLLLLPRQTATGEDLLRGLQAASRTIGNYRPVPGKRSIITLRFGEKRREPSTRLKNTFKSWDTALVRLKQSPASNLPTHGEAQIAMMVAPVRRQH